jgi:hypothetical protein
MRLIVSSASEETINARSTLLGEPNMGDRAPNSVVRKPPVGPLCVLLSLTWLIDCSALMAG